MIPYIVIHSMEPHNSKCWTMPMGSLEWVHYPVPLLCLAVRMFMISEPKLIFYRQINCLLLMDIVRVLCTKLRSSPHHFKAALKSVLYLVPVFGVHYIFYVTKQAMEEDCVLLHEVLNCIGVAVDSLQGTIVASVFCFLNSEVRNQTFDSSKFVYASLHRYTR